ncbi:uncharacterized protein TA09905 [Theileria annulata]|uniref:Pentacotripeptide-repeat region of PRORP domain-containing protein n=1 Tax=Theileria annulata TaxID=5874 RepID=Q4U8P4_THEAN|nr:uncharacterized protein TA09905 [Theileria annulata]CAI76809.1 hypothetical protein, conserved [Theileria annulata]|eukprot:XP_953434.1 hypothetical protein, conserved [Theileria annulata]
MFFNFLILVSLHISKYLLFLSSNTHLLLLFIFIVCYNVLIDTHLSLPFQNKPYLSHNIFCKAYKYDINPFLIGRYHLVAPKFIKSNPSQAKNPKHFLIFSVPPETSGIGEQENENLSNDLKILEDSSNSLEKNDENFEEECTPGPLTESDVWKMKAAISQNSTLGIDWVKAIETLQTSSSCTVKPLTIAYNSAISAAEKNSNPDLCMDLISDMKKRNDVALDSVTYKMAISACVKTNRVEDALKLQEEALESGLILDHGVIRNLLWLLSFNGYGPQAIKLFELLKKVAELRKSEKGLIQTDYLHTIESCMLSNMISDSLELYNQLKKSENFVLDSRSLKTLLELAYNLSDSQMSLELYFKAVREKKFNLSHVHFKLILNNLLLTRNLDHIDYIWKNILHESVLLDPILCHLVLQGYSLQGNFQKAYDVLTIMERDMLLTNHIPYLLAIKSCEKCGEWKLALKIMRMAQHKLKTKNISLYNGVLEACLVAKEWNTMTLLYEELSTKDDKLSANEGDLRPNGDTIALALIAYFNLEDDSTLKELLSIPVIDTPLLSKIRNSLTQEQI